MSSLVDVWCGGCPFFTHSAWWMSDVKMSGVVDVRCGGGLLWSMSCFTQGVVEVWCSEFLVWWISFFAHSVADVWFGPVDVCVADVIKSILMQLKCISNLSPTLAPRILGHHLRKCAHG